MSTGIVFRACLTGFKSCEGQVRKTLRATLFALYCPRHVSVKPPEATAISPHSPNPSDRITVCGSLAVAPQMEPSAHNNANL